MFRFLAISRGHVAPNPTALALPVFFAALVWLVFVHFFDITILNPQNIGWITDGDLRQHYLGWVALRQAETLGQPLGTSPLLAYPFGAPISSTDSNPLISLLLWPVRDLLPRDFQFIGPWYLMSLILSLLFATGLFVKSGFDRFTALLLGAVLAFQPILFWRYGHDTLTAQWLILGALYASVAVARTGRALVAHAVLLGLAMAIHPYLFMMLAIIAGFDILARVFRAHGLHFGMVERVALLVIAAMAGAVFVGSQLGVFTLENAYPNVVGVFSADPLGFLNPFDASRTLPQLPAGQGQYEGFAFLGLGGLLLLLVVLVLSLRGGAVCPDWGRYAPLIAAGMVAYFFALSPVVMLFGQQVFALDLSEDSPVTTIFAKLRSSGRFIWVTIYVLMFVVMTTLPRNRDLAVRCLALIVLAVQIWDLAPLKDRIRADTAFRPSPVSVFDETDWQDRIARADYVYMSRGLGLDFSLDVGAAAFPLNTPLSWFYTAQGLGLPKQIAAEEQLTLRVQNGQADEAGLYLLDANSDLALVHRNAGGIRITHRVQDFHVIETRAFVPDPEVTASTHGLTELLATCAKRCTALLTTQGDATPMLSAQVKLWVRQRGGKLDQLAPGGGYTLILRNGAIVDEVLTIEGNATANAVVGNRAVSLLSSVEDPATPSQISLDGVDLARGGRGVSLLLVHDDGRLVSAGFDTGAQSDSLFPDAQFQDELLSGNLLGNSPNAAAFAGLTPEQVAQIPGPVSAESFVNMRRVLTRESSLLDVLSRCRQECTMAISVKDEGSTSLPLAVRGIARQMGLTLSDLEFRDGYSAIVENGIVLVQGRSFDEVVDVAEISGGQQIRVRSGGYLAGNLSSITFDGTEQSLNKRGINIAVLIEGQRVISYHFDTHGGL